MIQVQNQISCFELILRLVEAIDTNESPFFIILLSSKMDVNVVRGARQEGNCYVLLPLYE